MNVSINFLFKPDADIKIEREKILSVFALYLKECGLRDIIIHDPGASCRIGKDNQFPIFFMEINQEYYPALHKIDSYIYFIELLKKAGIKYEELYVNNEAEGNFFSVFPTQHKTLTSLEIEAIGYFHLISKGIISNTAVQQLKNTNQFLIQETSDFVMIFKAITDSPTTILC